jgi:hypothetical protein
MKLLTHAHTKLLADALYYTLYLPTICQATEGTVGFSEQKKKLDHLPQLNAEQLRTNLPNNPEYTRSQDTLINNQVALSA